jgi:hypothetical protein
VSGTDRPRSPREWREWLYRKLYSKPIAAAPKDAPARRKKSVQRKIEHVTNEDRRLRDSALKQKIPSSLDIAKLFAIANGNTGTPETERVQKVDEILANYRSQRQQFADGEINGIDPLLMQGIEEWGRRIFAAPDPVRALKILLGLQRPRGKRAKNAERDVERAIAVLETRERMSVEENKRVSLERAAEEVAETWGLEHDYVLKLYKRHRLAAKAERAFRAERRVLAADTRP